MARLLPADKQFALLVKSGLDFIQSCEEPSQHQRTSCARAVRQQGDAGLGGLFDLSRVHSAIQQHPWHNCLHVVQHSVRCCWCSQIVEALTRSPPEGVMAPPEHVALVELEAVLDKYCQ